MKILRVRFCNLNSLRGEHEVDFGNSPLADAGLFAITGPTGAGKTTILDAITLALYGQVPRHDGGGPEAVMSHGTGESWAEVEFQAGGAVYRAKWGQHRARRKPDGPLQDPKMELSQRPDPLTADAQWPILESYKIRVPARVAEISGLEYRQFLRSVLLAQGEFTRFLKSSAGERAQLLEKLTDTRKYSDISKAAYERAKQETQQVETLRAGLAGVVLLAADEVAELEADVQELAQHLQKATTEQHRLAEAQAWHSRLQELAGQQQRSQSRLHQLAAEAETLTPVRQRVARHEQALPFQTPWALLRQADEQHQRLGVETERLRQQVPQLQAALAAARTARAAAAEAHAAAAEAHREQQPRLNEADKLDSLVAVAETKLREQRQEYEAKNERCKQLKAATEAAGSRLRALRQQLDQVQEWLTQHRPLQELGEALPTLAGNLQDWDHLRAELGQLLRTETVLQRRLTAAEAAAAQSRTEAAAATAQLATTGGQQRAATARRDQWHTRLHRHEAVLRQQYADLERAHHDLRRLVQAHGLILSHEAAREHLTEGEPCPLCGATEHPFAAGGLGVSPDSMQSDQAREEALGHRVRALNTRLNRVQALVVMLENNGGHLLADAALPPLAEAEEAEAPAQVRELSQQMSARQQRQQELALALANAQSRVQQATDQHRELTQEIGQVRIELADAREREPLVRGQLASLCSSFGLKFTDENGPELLEQLKRLGTEFQAQQKAQAEAEKALAAEQASLTGNEAQKVELQAWLHTRKNELVTQHAAIEADKQQRQTLFAGSDVAAARERLETALRRAEQQLAEADQQQQRHETALAGAETQLRQREQDAAEQAQTRDVRCAALVAGLRTAGLPPAPTALAERLLPDDVAQRLTQQLARHDQAMAAVQHALTETAQQLQTEAGKALSAEPAETIARQLHANREQLAAFNQQLGQRQERLNGHRSGLARHAALATELDRQQQEARRWRQLAEVIGSADGKKFSEFAQGLTLARLVDLANRHLVRLTDRYRIRRNPAEHLDLLVLDEYQAGSTRSMNSLSGGESFLVSLALALGLSELAGRKTQIDTLFIDEGFGTLDPDALDVALTALEMLQGTGKTIGIISHVEALKERVSTQINVRKGAGGVSTIRVVGL